MSMNNVIFLMNNITENAIERLKGMNENYEGGNSMRFVVIFIKQSLQTTQTNIYQPFFFIDFAEWIHQAPMMDLQWDGSNKEN